MSRASTQQSRTPRQQRRGMAVWHSGNVERCVEITKRRRRAAIASDVTDRPHHAEKTAVAFIGHLMFKTTRDQGVNVVHTLAWKAAPELEDETWAAGELRTIMFERSDVELETFFAAVRAMEARYRAEGKP